MILKHVQLKNYRNFTDCSISICEKTLIIGANEVGKTNLIHAIRLIMDKSLSEIDLDPKESDFNIETTEDEFKITLTFSEATEDHIVSQMRENISADASIVIQFIGYKNKSPDRRNFKILVGPDLHNLEETESRFYLKSFHLQYIDANRDIYSFLRREKKKLLEDGKGIRNDIEIQTDQRKISGIQKKLGLIEKMINGLSYIKKSTQKINRELSAMSHVGLASVSLNTHSINPDHFIDSLELSSKSLGSSLAKGGEGRNNQIFLALWASKFKDNSTLDETIFFAVEEPEAHLHPHQQRSLAKYLVEELNGQLLLTSHSPQIASEFDAGSIVHLYRESGNNSIAANNGCSTTLKRTIIDFGHRLNIIPAECYFAKVVILVEGISEVLVMKSFAKALNNFDLDKMNISIQCVDGVGFKPYLELFKSLNIKYILMTDNDIFRKANSSNFIREGFNRGISFYKDYFPKEPVIETSITNNHSWIKDGPTILDDNQTSELEKLKTEFAKIGIFIADKDLETDLSKTSLYRTLLTHHACQSEDELIKKMKEKKAENMFDFLFNNQTSLYKLKKTRFHDVLKYAEKIAQ